MFVLLHVLGTWSWGCLELELSWNSSGTFCLGVLFKCFGTPCTSLFFLRCSGSHVVDFLHGLLVTVGLALSSEGFEFQCTTCRIWEGIHN